MEKHPKVNCLVPGRDGETPVVALVGGSASSITMPVASVAGVRKVPQAWRWMFCTDAAGENHQTTSNGCCGLAKHGDFSASGT